MALQSSTRSLRGAESRRTCAVAPVRAPRSSSLVCHASSQEQQKATAVNRREMLLTSAMGAAAAVASSGIMSPAPASAAALSPNEETVAKFYKLLGSKTATDEDAVLELVAPNAVFAPAWPGAPVLKGKEGVKVYLGKYKSTLSFISGKTPTFVSQGDNVVAFPQITYLVKSSRRTFTYSAAQVFKFNKDNKITSWTEYPDTLLLEKEGVAWKTK